MTRSFSNRDRSQSRDERVDVLFGAPDDDYARPFTDALEAADTSARVTVSNDSEAVLEAIAGDIDANEHPRPDVVVVDLELFRPDSLERLAECRARPENRHVPLLVIADGDETDVARSYEFGANAYVEKPEEPAEFASFARSFGDFWLSTVQLPTRD
ncbi:response regulator [Natronolimnohabitans innermongolicus]|uniref:Response regulator receiver protein n=1 Tax=Natronolimnohabitans innermongolicus JCM 12255 TaxID=1227499 RepID=L9XA82_9EURY|nr:response regulator [Natronolimnohabitans innermongolicus]ELY57503.1 response regulator receiver protein [Natronolimnohabitans innermongolicus JCM 12255]